MKNIASSLLLLPLLVSYASSVNIGVRKLGQIKTLNPAFLSVEKFEGQKEFLLVSSFGAISSGHVYVIPDIADIINNKAFDKVKQHFLGSSFLWPNEVATVPKEVFG